MARTRRAVLVALAAIGVLGVGAGLARAQVLVAPESAESWTLENHTGATSVLTSAGGVLKLEVIAASTEHWHVQFYQGGKSLVDGATYTVTFRVKADRPTRLAVNSNWDEPDYKNTGLYHEIDVGTTWQEHKFEFVAADVGKARVRLPSFQAGTKVAVIEIAGVTVTGPVRQEKSEVKPLPASFFPFVIPWDDARKNVATDLSALNHAGRDLPRIVVRDGHFVEETGGRRVRFWATNLGADEAFPSHADADKVAARLAKYGINLVRLHHLDNPWAIASGGSIWDRNNPKRVIDPAQLDKLQYLIAAFARNGIYTNLNLKVSKTLSAADGMPESINLLNEGMSGSFQKKVDRFARVFIDHQKLYARQILTAPNPHRGGQPFGTDPAVAFIELNNENTAAGWPGEAPGVGLQQLPEPFLGELKTRWNQFLKQRYGTQEKLVAAWTGGSGAAVGPTVLTPAMSWIAVQPGASEVTATQGAAHPDGPADVTFNITKSTGTDWHAQGILGDVSLKPGGYYTLEFEARGEPGRLLRVSADLNAEPWTNMGLNGVVALTPEFQPHRMVFRCREVGNNLRIALQLGEKTGTVALRNVKLLSGVKGEALKPGESLAKGDLSLPGGAPLPAVAGDWQRFVTDLDRTFAEEMFAFLRKDLGAKGLVADTQIQWGGTGAPVRERNLDWTDSHSYWNHPNFPGAAWSPRDWTVAQRSLVVALSKGDSGTLGELALHRIVGKPFSVSEYDHPAPNDYASEMMPLISSFAALQDWDKIYTFAYAGYGTGKPADRIQGFFDQGSHPGKWAFNPSAALILRQGLVDPLTSVRNVPLPEDTHGDVWTTGELWGPDKPNVLSTRVGILPFWTKPAPAPANHSSIAPKLLTAPNGPVYLLDAPKALVATGFLGGTTVGGSGFQLVLPTFPEGGNNFASMTLVPLDGKPLAGSSRLLLTILGRAENPGMAWNADRSSVGDQWGTGPVHVEGVSAELSLPTGANYRVYPLTPTGERSAMLQVSGGKTRIGPTQRTVWYEIVRE
jgi:hypothetical protein